MAATQYQIFCRYLNETVNKPLTNQTPMDWISAEELTELTEFYDENRTEYLSIKNKINTGQIKEYNLSVQELNIYTKGQRYDEVQDKIEKDKIAIERFLLEPIDSMWIDPTTPIVPPNTMATMRAKLKQAQSQRALEHYDIVIEEATATNPKYDMVFMYDGIAYGESLIGSADYHPNQTDETSMARQMPYVYYDRMKRIKLDPWFLFSTHASLNSAMAKARELVNILGKDAVKIGKIVPLDQYIEIV